MYQFRHFLTFIFSLALSVGVFASSDSANYLEETVVVASKLPTERYKLGKSVTVLNELKIKELGYQYAADLLRTVPGIAVSRTGGYGGLTQIRLRGAEGNHVLVLIDGVDVSSADRGEFDISSLLTADIARIEILRGPQSGLYGSNSLAGVINIQTKRAQPGFQLNTELETGSDSVRQAGVSISGGSEKIRGRLSMIQRQSELDVSVNNTQGADDDKDDNRTINGQINLSLTEQLQVDVFARHNKKETDADDFDFSGGDLQGLAVDDDSFNHSKNQTFGINTTWRDQYTITRLLLAKTDTESDGGSFASEASRDQVNLNSHLLWGDAAGLQQRSTLFVEYEQERYRNLMPSDPSQQPEQERNLFAYGLEHRVDIDEQVFLSATVRRDNNDKFDDETTFSVGASYRLTDMGSRIHSSIGTGVTNPTFAEQFGFTPGRFVGNPDLTPEKSTGWDLGVEKQFANGAGIFDVTYFSATLEDEIESTFDAATSMSTAVNASSDSDREGIEASLSYQYQRLSLVGAYTYTHATEQGEREVRRPLHTASVQATQRFWGERAYVSGAVIYHGAQLDSDFRNYYDNNFTAQRTELDSYTLVNVNAGFEVVENLELYARIENAFDEDYEEVISYATPGRAVFAGVRYQFSH